MNQSRVCFIGICFVVSASFLVIYFVGVPLNINFTVGKPKPSAAVGTISPNGALQDEDLFPLTRPTSTNAVTRLVTTAATTTTTTTTTTTATPTSSNKLKQEYFIFIAAMWDFHKDWVEHCRLSAKEPGKTKCTFSRDNSLLDKSDAVVFLARGSNYNQSIKSLTSRQRNVNQRWIMVNRESPLNVSPGRLSALNGLANWTMTYMKSSDVVFSYYFVKPGTFHGGFNSERNYLEGRTKMAAILISNCGGQPLRMEWVHKMQQYINVTVLGNCGTRCSDCASELKKHKFYLSFENSYCREYFTEKAFNNGFNNFLVPIVIADVDFNDQTVIPPNSTINALDFSSVKELTDHMKRIASNSTLYNEYFKWHSHYDIRGYGSYCDLCRRVANDDHTTKIYTSLENWFGRERLCGQYPVPH